jgi:hypothetical protein
MRGFVGIDLGRKPVPDEMTVYRFRHLLEEHDLGRQLFYQVQRHLADKGLKVGHRHDCRCDHYQCAVFHQECQEGARSRDASTEFSFGWQKCLAGDTARAATSEGLLRAASALRRRWSS